MHNKDFFKQTNWSDKANIRQIYINECQTTFCIYNIILEENIKEIMAQITK